MVKKSFWIYVVFFVIILVVLNLIVFQDYLFEKGIVRRTFGEIKEIISFDSSEEDESFSERGVDSGDSESNGGTGSSEEGSSGTETNSLEQTCSTKKISYSLQNFGGNFECLGYEGLDCVNMKADCSVEVHNLDNAASQGDFDIEFSVIERDGRRELASENQVGSSPPVGEFSVLEKTIIFMDSGGITESLDCISTTNEVPVKEVCV